ncbi:MAG TPA: polysaccharide biosynthesis/export family protein [Candidatus Polarisedimenticolia bacterium]|nr:polysaccharide biosynthesis/export family protein [Candidatus Polarisedimenticolia bacterium]
MKVRLALAVGIVVALLAGGGCAAKRPDHVGISGIGMQPPATVRLAPGDVVDVKFFSVAELNESQAIRPDGKIALQLVGDVEAQGKSPAELREELIRLYTPHLKTADVTVVVRSFQSRHVYVGGEVLNPGSYPMPGQLTALEAVMQAGGFTRYAQLKNVVIIRHQDGQRYGASLDFSETSKGTDVPHFYLEPLDVVYVPETRITRVNRWIDQHINQLLPTLGVIYEFPAGEGTVTIDTTRYRAIK